MSLSDQKQRERIRCAAQTLLPHIIDMMHGTARACVLRIHISDGVVDVSWPFAIGNTRSIPGTTIDTWMLDSRIICARLVRGTDSFLSSNPEGKSTGYALKIQGGILAAWGLPAESARILCATIALSQGLVTREHRGVAPDLDRTLPLLDVVYGS